SQINLPCLQRLKMRQTLMTQMYSLTLAHQPHTIGLAAVEFTTITKVHPVTMVSPSIMAYPIIVVDLTTLMNSKTSMTMSSPAMPTTPTTPPVMVSPTIMVETTVPHPFPRILPMTLSSPTSPMVRTTLAMSTTMAGDTMGGPANTGSPTTMVGFITTLRFPTIVGSIAKVRLTTIKTPPNLVTTPTSVKHIIMYRHGSSQLFGSHTPHTVTLGSLGSAYSRPAVFQPSKPDRKTSAFSLAHSLSTVNSHPSETSNKVYPQDSSSKTSESCPEEDEHVQKRKVGRAPRAHKKVHSSDFLYWLWEKLSQLIWGLRRMLRRLVDSLALETFIIFIVCLNTIMLVAQTFAEWYFTALDYIFLSIYVVEAVLKIIALGLAYFLDPWNNLDFFIMVMGVVDFTLIQVNSSSTRAIHNQSVFRIFKVFKTLRALRAIRVLRRLRFLTNLQEVTGTLARSLPSITAILILMFTCLFLFSVVLRALFRYSDPKRFQNIFTTIFTLFTMLTLDDWSLIYLDSRAHGAWYIIPILMIYIIIQYFIFLNLVIAVLVDNFQMALLKGLEKVKQEKAAELHEELLDDSLETLFHFLQLVAGVEHYQLKFRSQAAVIDEIVDTTFEAGEEDFRK
ncbi:hypothetical protein Celaphus_00013250, partial [Cervus elaphus hippelaphus]